MDENWLARLERSEVRTDLICGTKDSLSSLSQEAYSEIFIVADIIWDILQQQVEF